MLDILICTIPGAKFHPKTKATFLLLFSHSVMFDSFAAPWTVALKAPLSMGFPSKVTGVGLPFPSPGDLPNPGFEPMSPALAGRFFTTEPPGKPEATY